MIELYDGETGQLLGQVTEEQLEFLIDHLEETGASDRDYYVDEATVDLLEDEGGDPELVELLREAVEGREGMEIRWEETR
ncbi:MAG TPA: hypothetical protein VFQ22_01350 [Longimicrobiales bacterium]|nr:hypothetical protein [Longimicrobiales bacterium]